MGVFNRGGKFRTQQSNWTSGRGGGAHVRTTMTMTTTREPAPKIHNNAYDLGAYDLYDDDNDDDIDGWGRSMARGINNQIRARERGCRGESDGGEGEGSWQ